MSKDKRDCSAQSIWSHLAVNLKWCVLFTDRVLWLILLLCGKRKTKQKNKSPNIFLHPASFTMALVSVISAASHTEAQRAHASEPDCHNYVTIMLLASCICLLTSSLIRFFVVVCCISRSRCIMVCDSMLCLWINMWPVALFSSSIIEIKKSNRYNYIKIIKISI